MSASDVTHVERARSGDREAFDELVRRHFAAVYRMLHRRVGNHEDAEDLAQECFVRAWGARRTLVLADLGLRASLWTARCARSDAQARGVGRRSR